MRIHIKIKDLAGIQSRIHRTAEGLPQTADTIVEASSRDLAYSIKGEVKSNIKIPEESKKHLENSIEAEKIKEAYWGVANTAKMPIYWAVQEFGAWIYTKSAAFLTFFRYGKWHKVKKVFISPKYYLLKGFIKWKHGMIQSRLYQFMKVVLIPYKGKI